MIDNMTPVVKQLLIINVIFFIGSQLMGERAYELFSLYYFENHQFKIWQPITHMFMHAAYPNITHILFNMIGLVSFGSALEHFWGGKRFLIFYILCGLGAALLHTGVNYYYFHQGLDVLNLNGQKTNEILSVLSQHKMMDNWPSLLGNNYQNFIQSYMGTSVGASGAIYGLLTAFAFMFPNAELGIMFIPIPVKAKYFVPALILMDLFSGVTGISIFGGGIAHFAHVGGAVTGFVLMLLWRNQKFNFNRWN